ncbi:hypothetical protein PHLCEN_2v7334 [Hermanssonia centrifuga]|uniref:Phospholipase C/P1 nuclease n=1 Tax=Hermanssonia centrifuga TaxID=98765 RepID=A0A2R6NXC7_9APHY|nr:hypothetical protein PHLCEN_2v7334 [Hermanssonia centrifuga]
MKFNRACTYAVTTTFILASVPAAYAWGAAGHQIVATIAQIYLHPTTLSNVCEILYPGSSTSRQSPPCNLATIASWADQIKRQPKYRYTAPLHYIGALGDHPSEACAFPGPRGWAGKKDANVLGAVRNVTNILVEYTNGLYDAEAAADALKFLVHYLGDMHMPLHLTGRDRGGNGDRVTFDGRVTNLHSLWDSLLIAQRLRTIPTNYTRLFPPGTTSIDVESHLRGAIYDPYVRRVMFEGMGVGSVSGRYEKDYLNWLSCPAVETQSVWNTLQTVFGLHQLGDESRWDDDMLCPFAWAKQLHPLNCDLVWPPELDEPPYKNTGEVARSSVEETAVTSRPNPHPDLLELDTPEYAGRIRDEWVVERLMAMAGVRLAGLLNGLFMNPEAFKEGLINGLRKKAM